MAKTKTKPKPIDPASFRALSVDEQIRAVRGQKVERLFTVERDGMDTEKRTAWLSIASEEPYQRWWGIEVLDLGKRSIRDQRLRSGAPLLVGHDAADQVGVVEEFEISSDRKLRILARFGKSARAEEVWQDVLDGIRRNTSVGYVIHDMVLERKDEEQNTYRVTDWEPYEGSLVAVPADPTVGVGRDDEPDDAAPVTITQPKIEAKTMTEEEKKALEQKAAAEAQARNQARVTALLAAGDTFASNGGPELARELIGDPNGTVEQFNARMLEKMRGAQRPTATAQPAESPTPYGVGARQMILRGRQLRSFTRPIMFTDGSKMEPEEAAYRSGQWLLATVGGNERARKWCAERGIAVERVMLGSTDSAGGYLVPTEMEQSIIDLREAYGLARRLTRRRPMGSDTRSVPKRTGGVTGYFINEDNEGVTASDKSWGNVNLVAKTLAALSLISKNLEEDSIIDTVDDLTFEQAYAFATKEDQCWLIGDGTSTYGGMVGLITLMEATAYASRITAATNHDTFAEIDNADLTSVMGGVADFAGLNPQWVASKLFTHTVFGRLKATAGGATGAELSARQRDGYLGYDANTSEIMPKVTTTLSSKVMALYGDFSMSSSFGDRRGIVVEVLRERYAEKLQVGILGHERFHIVNHDLGSTTAKGPVAALYGA
jgi:HK97 family phage major capsid protein